MLLQATTLLLIRKSDKPIALQLLSKQILSLIISAGACNAQETVTPITYPKTTGYASIVHPIVTITTDETVFNFTDSYTVGFPCGLNIIKSDRLGFSFEIVPVIRSERRVSRVSNFLFHPGILLRFKHGFTLITRAAFETSGRYGATIIFNKVVLERPNVKYFVAVPVPLRVGNDKAASVGIWFQVGMAF
jgi:hypothetical protein